METTPDISMKESNDMTDMALQSEIEATASGAFLCFEPERGLLLVRGNDARDLLHRLSTARIDSLGNGDLRETLLTNEKGRVIDALLAVQGESGLRLLTSAGRGAEVKAWMEKFTIMEDCTYEDISATTAQFSVYNIASAGDAPERPSLLPGVALPEAGKSVTATLHGIDVEILRHESVTGAGLRLLCRTEDADALLRALTGEASLPLVHAQAFALWRIGGLVPAVGHELGERANPLEAGAQDAVDFRKGCFIGQEVIARLDSYDKVQRHPRRLRFGATDAEAFPVGTELHKDGVNAGFVTTAAFDPGQGCVMGVGLVRLAFEDPGTVLQCGETAVEVLP
jgi:tRNA-modifying protein YgfZ